MENPITIREAITENEASLFWERLYAYEPAFRLQLRG